MSLRLLRSTLLARVLVALGLACLSVTVLACTAGGVAPPTGPGDSAATLDWQLPAADAVMPVGQPVQVYAILQSPRGVSRAELYVDGALQDTVRLVVSARRLDLTYQWTPTTPGGHTLSVIGYDPQNVATTFPPRTVSTYGAPLPSVSVTPIIVPGVTPVIITATPAAPFVVVTPFEPTLAPPTFGAPNPAVITATPNLAPLLKKLTPTLTPTPVVIIVPFGQ